MKTTEENRALKEDVNRAPDPDKEYKRLKIRLEELEGLTKSKGFIFLLISTSLGFAFLTGWLLIDTYDYNLGVATFLISGAAGLLFGCFFAAYSYMAVNIKQSSIRRQILEYDVDDVQNEIKDDIFENSIKMSYKYLDQYYLQTREHAQRGFFVTVCVSLFGAVLIGVGIIAMFLDHVTPSYITCASGVITEFIAAIFFYLYNRTVASMSNYHNKLVLSQNISIALKVSESLPTEDKVKAKNSIINELLKDINVHLVKTDSADEEKSQ